MKPLLDFEALARQEEGQFFDRKSLWEGTPGAKRVRDRRTVRDEIAAHVAMFSFGSPIASAIFARENTPPRRSRRPQRGR
jgi:hypothetical protein